MPPGFPFPTPPALMPYHENTLVNTPDARDVSKDGDSAKAEEVETVTVDDLLNIPLPKEDDVTTESTQAARGTATDDVLN